MSGIGSSVFRKKRDVTRVRALYLRQRTAVNNHLKKLRAVRNPDDLAEEGCRRCAGPPLRDASSEPRFPSGQ
jgi:hypothetical protein